MPKSLHKVHKHIIKKKGKNLALHANSRDSRMLQRAAARDSRVQRVVSTREKLNAPLSEFDIYSFLFLAVADYVRVERLLFLRERTESATQGLELSEIQDLIQEFIARLDDDLDKLRLSRRAGRPATPREEILKQQRTADEKLYDSGYWVPDLTNMANLEALRAWRGDWVGLNTVKFVEITKDGKQRSSQFPP
jgi:translation machinery-associated protein 16